MHLEIRVPNTWYRAVLEWRDEADASQTRLLAGLTLPGHPTLVTGSNTYVAWGFTNAQVDTSDLVLLEIDPMDPNRYWTPGGWRGFDRFTETIEVKGGSPVKMDVRWTIWGPVSAPITRGGCGPTPGRHIPPSGWPRRCCRSNRQPRSKRRSTRPTGWGRRRRTWWSPTAAATSPGRFTGRCRGASA